MRRDRGETDHIGTASIERRLLSDHAIAAYRRDGLVVAPYALPPDLLERMRDSLDKLLRDNSDLAPESLVCPHIAFGATHDSRAAADWLEFASNPHILDLVGQLLGPDIILWGSQVFCKPAGTGKAIPWHQDGHYWPIRPLATCSAWIALDNASADNGCMRYIAGSHASGSVYRHRVSERKDIVLDQEVDPSQFDERNGRDNILTAGQISLHDVFLIHGSNANQSHKRRAAFVVRYMPATSVFERAAGDRHNQAGVTFSMSRRPIWLLRGRDRTGRNDFQTGHGEDYALVRRVSDEDDAESE